MQRIYYSFVFLIIVAISASAQGNPFPNELANYEFFGKGKLETIVFGVSKIKDVEKLFGSSCENDCEYDDRFVIKFDYLTCDDCMTTMHIRDRAMCPLAEFMGTIEKITLKPKVPIQFDKISTTRFKLHTGGAMTSKDGSGSVSWESFGDDNGLKYSIRQGTTYVTLTTPGPAFMHGSLYSIDYGLNEELETKIFKAPFKSCINSSARKTL
ncbi:MAG: hypothetical protein WKF92_04750 [Pyrinomonadaceae bacterium]